MHFNPSLHHPKGEKKKVQPKAGHRWLNTWLDSSMAFRFRSIYSYSRSREVDLIIIINISQTGLMEKFLSISAAANQCILTEEEFVLSEYNSAAERIPPSLLVWMWESVQFFFFDQPACRFKKKILAWLALDGLSFVYF